MRKNTQTCSKCYGVLTVYDEVCPHCKNKDIGAEKNFSKKIRWYLKLNYLLIGVGFISFLACFFLNISIDIPMKILNVACLFTGIIFFLSCHLASNSRDKHIQLTFIFSSIPVLIMIIYGILLLVVK